MSIARPTYQASSECWAIGDPEKKTEKPRPADRPIGGRDAAFGIASPGGDVDRPADIPGLVGVLGDRHAQQQGKAQAEIEDKRGWNKPRAVESAQQRAQHGVFHARRIARPRPQASSLAAGAAPPSGYEKSRGRHFARPHLSFDNQG